MTAPGPRSTVSMTETEQRERVLNALESFQAELRAYRQLTKKPPRFLRDGVAEPLQPETLGNCRVFPSREHLVKTLLSGGIGAEVGVQHGTFSRFLLDKVGPEKLHLFDMAVRLIAKDVAEDVRTEIHGGDSSAQLGRLPDRYFDWIYVDGDHRLAGVKKDSEVALRKVKPGGLLIFNDYTPWSIGEAMPYGVMPVVNALANSGLSIVGLALASHGYFDIALRA